MPARSLILVAIVLVPTLIGLAAPPAGAQGLPGITSEPAPTLAPAPVGVVGGAMAAPEASPVNDYPTSARAEYVFACMATNGQTADVLRRCSCSIDVIASILPYDTYVEAETVLAMLQTNSERVAVMRSAPRPRTLVQDLRRAQAEGSVRCF
jgi:hypothetical protein